jgi:hypothetical protein
LKEAAVGKKASRALEKYSKEDLFRIQVFAQDVRSVATGLMDGKYPPGPREQFLKLHRSALNAYLGWLPTDTGYKITPDAAERLTSNPAAATLLLFFLTALQRYAERVENLAKPTATEIRAALSEAFFLTRTETSGRTKRGAPVIDDDLRIQKYFEDALYEAAISGYSATLSNEKALQVSFFKRYRSNYRGLASQRHQMRNIKRIVRERDLAFDHDEDMKDW